MRKFHPLANLFPLLEGDELEALANDMKAHGQHDAIVMFEDKILDGRNRERAGTTASLTLRYREFDGTEDEARDYVISVNIMRRNLTRQQRDEIMDKLIVAKPGESSSLIARQLNINYKMVERRRKKLIEHGQMSKLNRQIGLDGKIRRPRGPNRNAPPAKLNVPPLATSVTALTPEQYAEAQQHTFRHVYTRPIQEEIAHNNQIAARAFSTAVRDFGLAAKEFLKIVNASGTFEVFGHKDEAKPFTPTEYLETLATMDNNGSLWFGKLGQHFDSLVSAWRLIEQFGEIISKEPSNGGTKS